jgi:hypothetical protein
MGYLRAGLTWCINTELMPLDETLNMDIHASARYHVAITAHLPNDDPIKYSFSTPNEISRVYIRLIHPVTGGALHYYTG